MLCLGHGYKTSHCIVCRIIQRTWETITGLHHCLQMNKSIPAVNTLHYGRKFTTPVVNHISMLKQYVSMFK